MAGRIRHVNPTLLIPLTRFAEQCARTFEKRLQGQGEGASPVYRRLDLEASDDIPRDLSRTLTELLHAGSGLPKAEANRPPQVLFVAALVELEGQAKRITDLMRVLRRELRRTGLPAQIALVVYLGPVGDRIPDDRDQPLLEFLEEFPDKEGASLLVVSDADAAGRRYFLDDIVQSLAMLLFYSVIDEGVQRLLGGLPLDAPANRRIAVGLSRLDVSAAGLRELLRTTLCARLLDRLTESSSEALAETGPALRGEGLVNFVESVFVSEGGSLPTVENAMLPTVLEWATQAEHSRLDAMADLTRRALLALLPPVTAPAPQPQPRHWLWRFLMVLLKCITLGWLPRPRPLKTDAQPREVLDKPCRPDVQSELCDAESMRLHLRQLTLAVRHMVQVGAPLDSAPWEIVASHLPAARAAALRSLPDIDEVIWELGCSMPVSELLAAGRSVAWLQERIDEVCDSTLRQQSGTRMMEPSEYSEFATQLAVETQILFPWSNGRERRMALVPEEAHHACQFPGYEMMCGRPGELVFVVAESGVSLKPLWASIGETQ